MIIRKVKVDDLKNIKKMDDAFLKAIHTFDYFKRNLNNIIVAVDGEIVGYLMFKEGKLMNLVVLPEYRKKGIGKMLVKEAMKKSRSLISRTRENNLDALEFLKHMGFKYKRKIEKYYKNGDNAIEMEWRKN